MWIMATNESAVTEAPVVTTIPDTGLLPAKPDYARYAGKRFIKDGRTVLVTKYLPRYAAGDSFIDAFLLEPVQAVECDPFLKDWQEL